MTAATWDASESEYDDPSAPGRPLPALVSLHFLRSALRRRWVACVLCAVAGLLTAAALLVVLPASHDAKAMLVLAHDPQTDPTRAMSTDVSLLTSRTVAAHTIAKLGLRMTSDEFLSNLTVVPVSDDLVSLTLTAPSDREAVRRLGILTSTYLDFRAEQISLQSTIVVDGMQQRIVELQEQVADLSQRIEQLSAAGGSEASALSDAIAQRAQVNGQIETLVQSVQDATLRNSSIASSSRVIDPAAAETGGVKRRIVLILASGFIGGAALGCGVVLFLAITSDKLRRRFDVAAALQVPVPVSVGRIAPVSSRWLWLPHLRAVNTRRAAERQRLARAIEMELALPGRFGRLAVACIDNPDEVCFALAAAAWDLAAREIPILLLDLSEHGSLEAAVRNLMPGDNVNRLSVLRPRGVPALARDPADLYVVGHEDEDSDQPSPADTDVSLILADLDPSVGADHLTVWTERVIVAVTAGRSSAERVRTAADLVRAAELDLRFAALLHADGTDESSGEAGLDRRGPMHLRKGQGSPDARSTNRTLEAR
jgi:capsular polysaccharide biosynthesis protein